MVIENLQAELKALIEKISKMKGIILEEKKLMKEIAREISVNVFEEHILGKARHTNSQKKSPSKPDAKEVQNI